MEENSEAQMETDASTTSDATGSHTDMETVIVIENLVEEDSSFCEAQKDEQVKVINITPNQVKTTNAEIVLPTPMLFEIPSEAHPLSLLTSPQKEFQVSQQKDMPAIKTYSRSPGNQVKSFQKLPTKPDQAKNIQPLQEISECPDKVSPQKDVKSPNKDQQQEGIQKSPIKPEACKPVQILLFTDDTTSEVSIKKYAKSSCKDQLKAVEKSPVEPEQPKDVLKKESKGSSCLAAKEDKQKTPEKVKDAKSVEQSVSSQKSPVKMCIVNVTNQKKTPEKEKHPIHMEQSVSSQKSSVKMCIVNVTNQKKTLEKEKHPIPMEQSVSSQKSSVKMCIVNVTNQKKTPEKEKHPIPMEHSDSSQKSPVKMCIDNPTNQTLIDSPLPSNTLLEKSDDMKINNTEEVLPVVESIPPVVSESLIEVLSEKSSDSALETTSDVTESHNKSISRELKSLIKSAKESKIISECTQLTTKTRKSRGPLDTSSSSLVGADVDRQIGSRRSSDNSQMSTCSEKSDKSSLKRSMRSQNPEFVNKVKLFLNSVTGKVSKVESDVLSDEETEEKKSKESLNDTLVKSPKKKKLEKNEIEPIAPISGNKIRMDPYCWRCHWAVDQEANEKQHAPMLCTVCPRSFHYKCLSGTERSKIISEKNWVCPECLIVLNAESSETRSPAMKKISLGCLCDLLKHALERMMDLNGVEPFMLPVDRTAFPDYDKYVVHPMDLTQMKSNIEDGIYGSTEAFLADALWILHNSIIFNTCDGVISVQSKLTAAARALVRSCRAEMGEIEACPECYSAAHSRRPTWFTEVCSTPHMLLWAKLKGFPYWPAKCMSVSGANLVDVRFFGAHDRAWVPARDCFLFSEKDPNNFRTKRQDILDSMQEAEHHIRNISRKYGKFVYPPFKTPLDPAKLTDQLKIMIPSFKGEIKTPVKDKSTPKIAKSKSRSNSKGSKSSSNDGEVSDGEDEKSRPRQMPDGAEIALEEDFSVSVDKDKSVTSIETVQTPKETVTLRKRRRSELEEAVITIMEGPAEKRKCVENVPSSQDSQPNTKVSSNVPAEDTPEKKDDKANSDEGQIMSTLTPVNEKSAINNSTSEKGKRPPIRMILKANKSFKISSPKDKENPEKTICSKVRGIKIERMNSNDKEKLAENKKTKRRNSKNKSLNASVNLTSTDKKNVNKTSDTVNDSSESRKDKVSIETIVIDDKAADTCVKVPKENGEPKENDNGEIKPDKVRTKSKDGDSSKENNTNTAKSKETGKSKDLCTTKFKDSEKSKDTNGKVIKVKSNLKNKEVEEKSQNIDTTIPTKRNSTASPKSIKELIQFDEDNTSLAVIARESSKRGSLSGLPTISSVRSLSSPQIVEGGIRTSTPKVVESVSDSSIFTPTSTDTVRNMKEAVSKLNKLRSDTDQSLVGKVGVCAFARMPTTPPAEKTPDKRKSVDIEIKSEPMDFEDADRQVEKLHLMNSFSLRPVGTEPANLPPTLREVRINKVTSAPSNPRKSTAKPTEPKNKGKKTFSAQRKEDGRSELNSKNSMVYIPIQPPTTQAPVRMTRTVTTNGNTPTIAVSRSNLTVISSNSQTLGNTSATQVVMPPKSTTCNPSTSSTVTIVSCPPTFPSTTAVQTVVPTPTSLHSVHTVPLITSVNGQWTFSLQPIMSVGGLDGLDGESTPSLLNGLGTDRAITGPPALMPSGLSTPASFPATPAPAPAPAPKPMVPNAVVVPTSVCSPSLLVPPLPQPVLQTAQASPTVNKTTEDTVGEPPRLQHKPLVNPLDASAPLGSVPPPSTAGPITAKLNQNAIKLTDFFRTILEDTIERLDEPAAELTGLKLRLEETRWRHQQEIDELKHNHELVLAEMRATFDKERARAVNEARRAAQVDLEAAVKLAKSKEWCANCSQEAQFYCCWNTSYCDYGCQRAHWAQHYAVCTQQRNQDGNTKTDSNSVNNRLQSPSENLPKTTAAPSLSRGPAAKLLTAEQTTSPQPSIIVSMVEDPQGNATVKCVGTYKPPAPAPAPLILNKPVNIMNNEDIAAAKKVVTSGGYLIVGAAAAPAPLGTPPRRPPTIQYFS